MSKPNIHKFRCVYKLFHLYSTSSTTLTNKFRYLGEFSDEHFFISLQSLAKWIGNSFHKVFLEAYPFLSNHYNSVFLIRAKVSSADFKHARIIVQVPFIVFPQKYSSIYCPLAIKLPKRKANIVQGIHLVVLLSVWNVSKISHDLVDIHSHLRYSLERWRVHFKLSTSDQRNLALQNFLNADNVLRGIKARILVML